MANPPRICIFGAGSIGCYLGGRLLHAGAKVTLIGRERLRQTFNEHPLIVSDYLGTTYQHPLSATEFVTDPDPAREADIVLVTVKSAATEAAGRTLYPLLKAGTIVVSMQNGISNAERLKEQLPHCTVLAGMVPYNVLQQAPGHFHQGTEGHLMAAPDARLEAALPWFDKAGIPLELRQDMLSVMWSKLLLNLNNPINALSDIPLKAQLSQRGYRRCLALAQQETLGLLAQANIPTIKLTAVPTPWIPHLMRLPDWLFTRLAAKMLAIDPIARSSMWEDLQAGRPTEVDWINGEVVRLAQSLGAKSPVNARLVALIHQAETGTDRAWDSDSLYADLVTHSMKN